MRHIPGPLLGSFSYSWVAQMALRGRGMDYEHLRKYGSIVRVSPTYVILDDPDDIRQINGGRNNIRRDDWYIGSKLDPYHDTLFSHLHPEPHDALKSKVAFAYSGRDNLDFEGVVDDQIMRFVDTLRERFLSKGEDVKSVDFAHFIRYFTLDIITTLGYGKSFGFMDAEGDLYGYTKGIEDVLGIIAVAADVPAFRRIFISPFLSKLFAPKPTDRKGVGKVQG